MNNLWILAQPENEEAPEVVFGKPIPKAGEEMQKIPSDSNTPATGQQRQTPFNPFNLVLLGLMFVVMYLLIFRGPQKKQQQQKQMVQSLQKNDRVRTIGGIIGTVVDIKGDEITLKVDESTNTKIKVVSSAIGKNLSKD
jgi:preprotein translocase subunit YajC